MLPDNINRSVIIFGGGFFICHRFNMLGTKRAGGPLINRIFSLIGTLGLAMLGEKRLSPRKAKDS